MAASHLYALLRVLQLVRPAFTEPSFLRFLVLFAGWVCSGGTHAVTEALVAAGVSGVQHHAAFHRFFSRARWSADEVGRLLLLKLSALGPLRLVLDDTLCSHKGPKVFGLGSHLDAVRSTRAVHVFCFGHVWVTLAVLVQVPFASRPWALPVLFRLYRTQAECQRKGIAHRKKTQLGRELVERVLGWLPTAAVELAADEAYSCSTVLKQLPQRLVFVGAMRPDAVLTRPRTHRCRSPKTGRWLTRDVTVPKPQALARDAALPWQRLTAPLYGQSQQVDCKEVVARWRSAAGERMLKVVVVRMTGGSRPLRVFFCTDASLTALQVVEMYAFRWSIELLFKALKSGVGLTALRATRPGAVLSRVYAKVIALALSRLLKVSLQQRAGEAEQQQVTGRLALVLALTRCAPFLLSHAMMSPGVTLEQLEERILLIAEVPARSRQQRRERERRKREASLGSGA